MAPLVMATFGKLGLSAAAYLQILADVACSTSVVDVSIGGQFLLLEIEWGGEGWKHLEAVSDGV